MTKSRIIVGILAGAMALPLAACKTNQGPRYGIEAGQPEQFRRYTNRPYVDRVFRWSDNAYDKVHGDLEVPRSEDIKDVLNRHGRPHYVRRNVTSETNDVFDEWAYLYRGEDKGIIVQFVSGDLVFEGELLDSDIYLIQNGYPDYAFRPQEYEVGPRREIWVYKDDSSLGETLVSFSDGTLVHQGFN